MGDGGGNDGAATVASALVVMTTFFRNVPGLVRDVTQRRHRCRRRVAAVPHHNVEKTVPRRRSSLMAPPLLSAALHQDGSRAITGKCSGRHRLHDTNHVRSNKPPSERLSLSS
mgnify:CR=1 FL=1